MIRVSEPRETTWIQQVHWTVPVATVLIVLFVGSLWYFGVLYVSEAIFAFFFMWTLAAVGLAARANARKSYEDMPEGKKVIFFLVGVVFLTARLGYWMLYESSRLRWLWLALICVTWVAAMWEVVRWRQGKKTRIY